MSSCLSSGFLTSKPTKTFLPAQNKLEELCFCIYRIVVSAVEREEFATLNSMAREGFVEKVSFEQNPAEGEGSSLQVSGGGVFQDRKRQVKRSCFRHFLSTRSSRMGREVSKAGRVRMKG